MNLDKTFGKLADQLKHKKTVTVRLKSMRSEEEVFVRGLIVQALSQHDSTFLINTVQLVIEELLINAEKAMVYRAYQNRSAGGETPEGGFFNFYKKQRMVMQSQIKEEVLFTIRQNEDEIVMTVENQGEMNDATTNIIRNRISSGLLNDDLTILTENVLGDEEAGGYGLAISTMALKRAGLPDNALSLDAGRGKITFSLTIPSRIPEPETITRVEKEIIDEVEGLPALADSVRRILELCNNPNVELKRIVDEAEQDQGMAGEILRLANSGAYAGGQVGSLLEAIKLIGLTTLSGISLRMGAGRILEERYEMNEQFTRHPVEVARLARLLARQFRMGSYADMSYAGALLYHIGNIILYSRQKGRDAFKEVVKGHDYVSIINLEELAYGMSHARIGGMLARKWNFPEPLCQVIEFHHAPYRASSEYRPLVNLVYLADAVFYHQLNENQYFSLDPTVLNYFNLTTREAFEMMAASLSPQE